MPVETIVLDDFSGGQRDASAPRDFSDGEWSRLFGLVVEDSRTVRSQWALHVLDGRPVSAAGLFDGVVVYRVETPDGPVWYGAGLPADQDPDPELDRVSYTEVALRLNDTGRGLLDVNLLGGTPG